MVTSLLGKNGGSSQRVLPSDLATALNIIRGRPNMEVHVIGMEKVLLEVLSSSLHDKVYSLFLAYRVSPEKVIDLLLFVFRVISFGLRRGPTKQLSEKSSLRILGPLYRYIKLYRAKRPREPLWDVRRRTNGVFFQEG